MHHWESICQTNKEPHKKRLPIEKFQVKQKWSSHSNPTSIITGLVQAGESMTFTRLLQWIQVHQLRCCQPITFLIALSPKGRSESCISITDILLNYKLPLSVSLESRFGQWNKRSDLCNLSTAFYKAISCFPFPQFPHYKG